VGEAGGGGGDGGKDARGNKAVGRVFGRVTAERIEQQRTRPGTDHHGRQGRMEWVPKPGAVEQVLERRLLRDSRPHALLQRLGESVDPLDPLDSAAMLSRASGSIASLHSRSAGRSSARLSGWSASFSALCPFSAFDAQQRLFSRRAR
jgi:hypothetical protein